MAFDPNTATPIEDDRASKFDASTAQPIEGQAPAAEPVQETADPNIIRAERRVSKRGGLRADETVKKLFSDKFTDKMIGSLEAVGIPFQLAQAAISTPALELSKTGFGKAGFVSTKPSELIKLSKRIPIAVLETLRGKRLAQYGDVLVANGAPENVASSVGLAMDIFISGALVNQGLKQVNKALLKKSDDVALRAVDDITEGVERASQTSKAITNSFWSGIDDVPVNSSKFLDTVTDLPDDALRIIQTETGKTVQQLADQGLTLKDIRGIKQMIGGMRMTGFDKAQRGLKETAADRRVIKAYSKVSKFLDETLRTNPNKAVSSQADELIRVNQAAEDAINATNRVKSAVIKTRGVRSTEGALQKATEPAGADFRNDVRALSKISKDAQFRLDRALSTLDKIASGRRFKAIRDHSVKALVTAGLIAGAFKLTSGGGRLSD